MKISKLLCFSISTWEERLLSVAFLQKVGIPKGVLPGDVQQRLEQGLVKLSCLPLSWAEEICVQVMLNANQNQ